KFPGRVRGVITRAVATIPETLDRVATCLEPGGRMLFMKGPDCDAEVAEASDSHADSFRLVSDHAYTIPGTPHARRLAVHERTTAPARPELSGPAYAGPTTAITSESNPQFKQWRDLLHARGIRKHERALLAGPRIVGEVLARRRDRVEGWI